jgi:predicted TIM-barrel fold metal-dependent hydrolase
LWATDYPHPDGFFPGAPKMVAGLIKNLAPAARHEVMAGGAMRFYGLN